MQKYKYAFDLEENLYSLTLDFDTYKLSSDEINKIHSNPKLDDDSNYIGKEIVYDHTYIYLAPKEFIEQYKLSNEQKIELYKNIGKIKIKEITPENIKDISFIFHFILQIKVQEEAEVQGYEMPISSYWQYIPFNQRMNFGIENVFRSQDKAIETQRKLDNYISTNTQDTVSLSDRATNILNQDLEENEAVSNLNNEEEDKSFKNFSKEFSDLTFSNENQKQSKNNSLINSIDLQTTDNLENLYTQSKQISQNKPVNQPKSQNKVVDLKKLEYKTLKYNDVKDVCVPKGMREGNENISYKFSRQIINYLKALENPTVNKSVPLNPVPKLTPKQTSGKILGSNNNIDYLIQDNHPEKILENGVGLIGKHIVPKGNNLLTSYHENCVSKDNDLGKKDRNIVYNIKANEDGTELTLNRANFSVDNSGVKAGASVVGDNFKEGNLDGLVDKNGSMKNGYIFTKDKNNKMIQVESKDKIIKNQDGTITVKLNKGEIFSFAAPESLKEKNVFASAMEFNNNKEVTLDIRSVSKQSFLDERCGDIQPLPLTDSTTGLSNLDKGNPKQVSGVFQNPNYEITGNITAASKDTKDPKTNVDANADIKAGSIIPIPPFEPELEKNKDEDKVIDKDKKVTFSVDNLKPANTEDVEAVSDKNGIKNKGCFSQNFHYKLKIDNYNPDKQYAVVLIPGGGEIGYQTQKGFVKVTPPSENNTDPNQAIIIPAPVNKETKEIEFDYFVAGGSSTPVYAKVVEADSLPGTQ